MFKVFIIPLTLLISIQLVDPANILCIYPRPAFSHQNVFRAITEKLLERGHQVTLLTTHPSDNEKSHENVTLIDVSFVVEKFNKAMEDMFHRRVTGFRNIIFHMINSEAELIDAQLNSSGIQKILQMENANFDVVILEMAGFSPYQAIAEKFNIPVVGVSSADSFSSVHQIMGNPANAIAHPDRILPFAFASTFKQRIGSCFLNLLMDYMIIPYSAEKYGELTKKYFPDIKKSHYELVQNIDLLMINAHPAIGFNRPLLANTIQLGFLHIKPPKDLPSDLQTLLDNSKKGAIFMSFGTIVSEILFQNNFQTFVEAFSRIPYDVFWKYDGENFEDVPKNVHIRKWYPQSDLLAHENIKLFITHGVSSIFHKFKEVSIIFQFPIPGVEFN